MTPIKNLLAAGQKEMNVAIAANSYESFAIFIPTWCIPNQSERIWNKYRHKIDNRAMMLCSIA
jgi:hypothetical protein